MSSCSRSSTSTRENHLAAGKKLLTDKDYSRAILELKNAAQAAPDDAEPYYQLGLAHLATGDIRTGAAFLYKAVEVNPKHVDAQKKLADLMARSKNPDTLADAEKRLQTIVTERPNDADALNTLAMTEYKLGRFKEAEASLEQALKNSPEHVRSLTNLASLKMANKDLKAAEELLKQATKAASKSAAAWIGLGRFYVTTGKRAEAGAAFEKAVEVEPKNGNVLFELGRFQVGTNQKDEAEETFRRLADLPEPRLRPTYANYLFAVGKETAGITEFERLVALDPKNRDYRTALVAAYFTTNRHSDAEAMLNEALRTNSKDAEARLQRAEFYIQTAKISKAKTDAEEAVRNRPEDPLAHYLLARVHEMEGNPVLQRHELNAALQRSPSMLRARIELAGSLIASQSYSAALTLLSEAPESQKQALPVLIERNWALIGSGDLVRARKGVETCLARGRTPDLLVQDGMLKLRERRTDAARAAIEEALKLNPNDLRAVQTLAATYFSDKQEAVGIAAVKKYVEKQTKSSSVQMYLGEILLRSGDRNGARVAFTAAKQLNPELATSDLMLAQMDLSEGKIEPAKNTLRGLLKNNRGVEQAAMLLGNLEHGTGDCAAAADLYRKAIDVNSRNWMSLNNYAVCLNVVGKHDEALKYAQMAKELDPDNPSTTDTLGWSLYSKGMFPSAARELQRLANSRNAVHQYHLAMAYIKAGDLEKGRNALESARRLDGNVPEAKMATSVYMEASQRVQDR